MRPAYETASDLEKERIVAPILERAWKCNLRKMSKFGSFDYAFEKINSEGNLEVKGFVEVKRRHCNHDAYPTIMVSATKRQQALSLYDTTGCPTSFVVAYDDLIRFISLIEMPCYTMIGGRVDRSDPADTEVVIHYQIGRMTDLDISPFAKSEPQGIAARA